MRLIENASLRQAEIKNEPYQAIYIAFLGFIELREPVGLEEEYDGLLYMDELLAHTISAPSSCK